MRNKKNHFLNKLTSKLNKAVMSVMAVALVVSALLLTGFDTVNIYQGWYNYNGVYYVCGDIFFVMDDNLNADTSRIMTYDERKAAGNLIDPETDQICIYIDGRYYDAKELQELAVACGAPYGGTSPATNRQALTMCSYKKSLAGVPAPVVTETPVVTEAPTATPEPTEEPEVTEAPEPTEVPIETPEPTEAPVVTETPEPTEEPEVTETPTVEVTPEAEQTVSGEAETEQERSFPVAAIVVLAFVLAGVIVALVLVMKKRK